MIREKSIAAQKSARSNLLIRKPYDRPTTSFAVLRAKPDAHQVHVPTGLLKKPNDLTEVVSSSQWNAGRLQRLRLSAVLPHLPDLLDHERDALLVRWVVLRTLGQNATRFG